MYNRFIEKPIVLTLNLAANFLTISVVTFIQTLLLISFINLYTKVPETDDVFYSDGLIIFLFSLLFLLNEYLLHNKGWIFPEARILLLSDDQHEEGAIVRIRTNHQPQTLALIFSQEQFHSRLLAAGFTSDEIRNHRTLSYFFDPVQLTLMDNPVATNTEEMVDAVTARNVINSKSRITGNPVTAFYRPGNLKNLLEVLVDEAIEGKKQNSDPLFIAEHVRRDKSLKF